MCPQFTGRGLKRKKPILPANSRLQQFTCMSVRPSVRPSQIQKDNQDDQEDNQDDQEDIQDDQEDIQDDQEDIQDDQEDIQDDIEVI